ncbi:MAG: single-stranded-DNA-specific exonuclease RecJ [Prevotellaceae bacterium]|jgi:single-stranded-DNA-specific exonuclease|nr:single-stranded-DNA-specific exonuclease RecJ [Prevotellaceae bacterium]
MDKRWILKANGAPRVVEDLASALSIEPSLANLLVQRGVFTYAAAKSFFRPQLDDLHDPFLMKDMDKAVLRLEKAVDGGEKILIYGDYDVDGTTAVSTVYSFFRTQGVPVSYFIPERYLDGYGIAFRGIDHAVSEGATLIIALDCGIKAVEKVAYAKSKGVDFIICDHHLPGSAIPDAVAVLDPQRPDCTYPYKDLSGCGVGYKLLQAYCRRRNIPDDTLSPLLDLVTVSIASDIVPITGENRVLAHYGLQCLNSNPRKGLQAIMRRSGLHERQVGIDDIVFRIGPRLNAAGRMESGKMAVDLLTAETDKVADEKSIIINDQNNDRKNVDRSITLESINIIRQDPQLQAKKTIVLYNPEWLKGVVGIVASRLVETFFRPTIILTESNGMATGSARSIPGFDLYQAIEACADLLASYGGHMYAAGLAMKPENVEPFINRFEEIGNRMISTDMLIPQVNIDAEINFAEITPKFYRILSQFQPFGPGNMSPVFLTRRAYGYGNMRLVGADSEHIKLDLIQENAPYHPLPAIAFNHAHIFDYVRSGKPIDVCYSITENLFRGVKMLQLRIKDIKKSE